jgi:hypothetical protein
MKGKQDELAEAREFTAINSANKMDVLNAYNSCIKPAVYTFYKVNCLVPLKTCDLQRSAVSVCDLLARSMAGSSSK